MNTEQQIKQAIQQGRFNDAIAMANKAISEASNDGNDELRIASQYTLGVAHRLNGDHEAAIEVNQAILSQNNKHARAHQELGYAYRKLNNTHSSAQHFYQATQLNPALLASWKALIEHYKRSENHQAQNLAQAQIDFLTKLPPEVLHGRDLMYEGKLQLADKLCRTFLQGNKHHPEGMLLLAEIGISLKVYHEAEFLLESCLTLHPEHKAAGIEYLKLLGKMGRFQAAKDCADKLLKAYPDHPPVISAKASALVGLGEIDAAIALYKNLLDTNSEQAGLWLLLGHAYKAAGSLEKAVNAYQRAYTTQSDFGDAYWSLANTKTYSFTEAEIQNMQTQVSQAVSTEDKVHFCFALGKAFEDKKSYELSFQYYAQGNQLRQHQSGYEPAVFEHQVENHKRIFTKGLFNQHSAVGAGASDPIFIVGLPRAGSTLLEQILASHSQVDGTMELHNILALAARLRGQNNRYPDIIKSIDTSYFSRFGEQYIQDTQVYRGSAPFFIDKMPNNFLHIGLIKLILPNAKIIDARREPMACCFSGFKQLFAEGQEFSYGLENIGRYYSAYVDMMEHWDKVLPGFILRIQHEDVIDNLERQVRRILTFCNLEFEQACVDFYKTKRTIKTPSSEQVRQPIFRDSMQQHMHYDKYLGALKQLVTS